jgi:hypothetical protein
VGGGEVRDKKSRPYIKRIMKISAAITGKAIFMKGKFQIGKSEGQNGAVQPKTKRIEPIRSRIVAKTHAVRSVKSDSIYRSLSLRNLHMLFVTINPFIVFMP